MSPLIREKDNLVKMDIFDIWYTVKDLRSTFTLKFGLDLGLHSCLIRPDSVGNTVSKIYIGVHHR
jgi:hypothetical protein